MPNDHIQAPDASPVSTPATTSAAVTRVAQPVALPSGKEIIASADAMKQFLLSRGNQVTGEVELIIAEFAPSAAEWILNGSSDEGLQEVGVLIAERLGVAGIESEASLEQFVRDMLFFAAGAVVRTA